MQQSNTPTHLVSGAVLFFTGCIAATTAVAGEVNAVQVPEPSILGLVGAALIAGIIAGRGGK